MKYFKAFAIAEKPFIQWHEWAKDIVELTEMGEFENPLIVAENVIPAQIYGICPWKIVGGELVERTNPELATYETEFLLQNSKSTYADKVHLVNSSTFNFGEKSFPMHECARLFYMAIDKNRTDYLVATSNMEEFSLISTRIDAFLAEYYKRILALTKPF